MAWEDIAPRAIASLARDLKITPQQAAGIVGQLGFESEGLQAINERAPVVPGSRGGFGWAQWTGPRRRAFESWAGARGLDINDPEANYGFLVHELQDTPESKVLDKIRSAKDAAEAGRVFTSQFLRPGVPHQDKRDSWVSRAMEFVMPSAQAASDQFDISTLPERVAAAREAGFSDDEIKERLLGNEQVMQRISRAREAGFSDDEIFGRLGFGAQAVQPAAQPTTAQDEPGIAQRFGRQLGLTARHGLEGLGQVADVVTEPIRQLAVNPAARALGLPQATSSTSGLAAQAADALGLPTAQGAQERVAGDVTRLMAGAGGIVGAGGALGRSASPMAQALGRGLAENPIQQIVSAGGAGAGSGIAREAGAGTGAQTAAALAGGLLAGSAANRVMRPRSPRGAPGSVEDLKRRAGSLYDEADMFGVTATPQQTSQFAADMGALAAREGIVTPSGQVAQYPKVSHALKLVEDFAGGQMTVPQMQTVRRALQDAAASTDGSERRIGTMMLSQFDNFTAPLAPQLNEARSLYAAAMRGQQLETLRDLAESRASQFSGSGLENALRTEYRKLNNAIIRGRERGWSPQQAEAIRRVAEGTPAANVARTAGKMAPTGIVSLGLSSGVPYMIGSSLGGPELGYAASLATMGAGMLGRNIATGLTSRNAQLAEQLAMGLNPQARSAAQWMSQNMPIGALYGTLLAGQP